MSEQRVAAVLEYWRSIGPEGWWKKIPAQDAEIRRRFAGDLARAMAGELDGWRETPAGSLALVILCDQMCRNMYRGSASMYDGDAKAVETAELAVERDQDAELALDLRCFLYMPFMHAESLELQRRSVRLFERLAAEGGADMTAYAVTHRRIIERFGRFPHRNGLLGRRTTDEEREFLTEPGSSF